PAGNLAGSPKRRTLFTGTRSPAGTHHAGGVRQVESGAGRDTASRHGAPEVNLHSGLATRGQSSPPLPHLGFHGSHRQQGTSLHALAVSTRISASGLEFSAGNSSAAGRSGWTTQR